MADNVIIPDHFRVATIEDFHYSGDPCLGQIYWLHSFHNDTLESHTLVPQTDSKELSQWIKSGRCYIETSRYEGTNQVIQLKRK